MQHKKKQVVDHCFVLLLPIAVTTYWSVTKRKKEQNDNTDQNRDQSPKPNWNPSPSVEKLTSVTVVVELWLLKKLCFMGAPSFCESFCLVLTSEGNVVALKWEFKKSHQARSNVMCCFPFFLLKFLSKE